MISWYKRIIDEFMSNTDTKERNSALATIIHLVNTEADLTDEDRRYIIDYLFSKVKGE